VAITDNTPLQNGKIGVLGVGVMGRTLIKAMIDTGIATKEQIWSAAKSESSCRRAETELGVRSFIQYQGEIPDTKVILLCVKPYQVDSVLEKLKKAGLSSDVLIISIAAGKTLAQMEGILEASNPVIRAMPNTPAVVEQGMTVICGGTHANQGHLQLARQIFEAIGTCIELEERHFDAVTGLCGSGPAYMYLIMEALADGGVRVGLPRDVALKIVAQTVLGAATMVQQTGRHPASLRDDVTTPAGCTIAGLLTLEDGKIRSVLARAVEEASQTAKHLGNPPG